MIKIGIPTEVELSILKPNEYNPRSLSEQEKKDLDKSLEEFGMVEVMVANVNPKRENVLIGGHQRYNRLTEKGNTKGWVIYIDLDLEKEKKLNLVLNKIQGSWDWDLLANFSKEMLTGAGFTEEEVMVGFGLNDSSAENVDPDRLMVLEVYPPEAPKLKEKAQIHFDNIEDYNKVKKAILEGDIDTSSILKLLK